MNKVDIKKSFSFQGKIFVLELARATLKKQTGIELSVGEIELLSKSSLGQQVLKGNWKATTENSLQPNSQNGIMNKNQNTGVDINGSTNPELLARGNVSAANRGENHQRQYGANTEIIRVSLGNAQQSTGISSRDVAAGESGWLSARNFPFARTMGGGLDENFLGSIRGVTLKNTDSIGRIIGDELQEKLSPTVFKTEDGTVISFFHWSPNSFDEFKFGDGAFHLGTLSAAITVKNRDVNHREGYILEGYVISKNPLVTPDLGKFGAYSVCEFLLEEQIIDENEFNKISQMDGFLSDKYDSPANVYVRELLKSMGYDTYLYQNLKEDLGSWSVGVFDADQIVIIAENGVLKENSGVIEADTEVPANFMPEGENTPSVTDGDSSLEEGDKGSGFNIRSFSFENYSADLLYEGDKRVENDIESSFTTKVFAFGAPHIRKNIEQVNLQVGNNGGNMIKVFFITENGTDETDITPKGRDTTNYTAGYIESCAVFPLIKQVLRFGIKLESKGTLAVDSAVIKYRMVGGAR